MADPMTIMMVAGTAFQFIGGMQQASQMEAQAQAQQEMLNRQAQHARLVSERNHQIITDRGKHDAAVLEAQAKQEQATSQREMIEHRRKQRLTESGAIAAATSSGGGAGDPTVLDIVGQIAEYGEFNAMTALYEGDTAAHYYQSEAEMALYGSEVDADMALYQGEVDSSMLTWQGEMARYQGESAARTQRINTISNTVKSGASLYAKYGPENMGTPGGSSGYSGSYTPTNNIPMPGEKPGVSSRYNSGSYVIRS